MADYRPSNAPADLRKSEAWPLHKARKRWRERNRKRIAAQAQARRDRAATTNTY
ncbi:hypothetical protein [Nesterenkonia rhizosphaerae]|uniref:HNH endonuclease n=1 Tax=Nesterenkonia rhizosphaerae TaxID=1348272 RepID=A0ABP9FST2_9MICC